MNRQLLIVACWLLALMTVVGGLLGCTATKDRDILSAERRAQRQLEASRRHREHLADIRETGERVKAELEVIMVQWAKKAIEIAESSDDGVTDVDVVALSAVKSAGYFGEYLSTYMQLSEVGYKDSLEAASRWEEDLAAAIIIRLLNRRRGEGAKQEPPH